MKKNFSIDTCSCDCHDWNYGNCLNCEGCRTVATTFTIRGRKKKKRK